MNNVLSCQSLHKEYVQGQNATSVLQDLNLTVSEGELVAIVVLQPVDVVHDFLLLGLDGGQKHQVLEVLVVGEEVVVQHDPLQKVDKLVRELGCHEGLHGFGDFVIVSRLWESGTHN